MPSPLHATIAELIPVMKRGDFDRFQDLYEHLFNTGKDLSRLS
jgi:hypothetical protein